MRDINPIRWCLFQLWLGIVGIIALSFWWTHSTMHSEDWATLFSIIVWVTAAIYHYAMHTLPNKERRNAARRKILTGKTPGVPARRT